MSTMKFCFVTLSNNFKKISATLLLNYAFVFLNYRMDNIKMSKDSQTLIMRTPTMKISGNKR